MLRLPVTLRDGRPVVTATGPLVSAHREGEEPETRAESRKRFKRKALRRLPLGGRRSPTCPVWLLGLRRRASGVSVPPMAGPCRCRSAPPGKQKGLSSSQARLFGNLPFKGALRQNCPLPCRVAPQKPGAWPCSSCSWRRKRLQGLVFL